MWKIKIGRHLFSVWSLIVIMLVGVLTMVLASHYWVSFQIPLEVKEPLEMVSYPSAFSLFPGEVEEFVVSVKNLAPLNYSVVLDFSLNDTLYQVNYVTFSEETYDVAPGQHDLAAWVKVESDAPAANVIINVAIRRGQQGSMSLLKNGGFESGTLDGWNVTGICQISDSEKHSGSFSAYISDLTYDNYIRQYVYPFVNLSLDMNIVLEGWVKPSKVGKLNGQYPCSGFLLYFYNLSSAQLVFDAYYEWSYTGGPYENTTQWVIFTLSGWNAFQWNFFSRNISSDVRSYMGDVDFSEIVLHSVRVFYHYSTSSPGSFYVDDVSLSATHD